MVEKKYGSTIRYPKDCHALALHISQVCKTNISPSTLKRLYGFVRGIEHPRLFTLDVISMYLGYKGWEELSRELNVTKPDNEYLELMELSVSKLKKGERVQLGYAPAKELTLEYLGKQYFAVRASNDVKTGIGDIVKLEKALLHYPLTVTEFKRGEKIMGGFTLGGISGITHIWKMME